MRKERLYSLWIINVFLIMSILHSNGLVPAKKAEIQNVASGKMPTSNVSIQNAPFATDGEISNSNAFADLGVGLTSIQIDFGASYDIRMVKLWHYYADGRTYQDVIVQLSNNPEFNNAATVFNNDTDNTARLGEGTDAEYAESSTGKTITFNPVHARYLKIYSNGSNRNVYNHYVEIQAWIYDMENFYRYNNLTYLDPQWVMYPQSHDFIEKILNHMEHYNIKYQMVDVGFFDRIAGTATYEDTGQGAIDGTMDPDAYAELANWVDVSRAHGESMKLIGSVNGNTYLHVQALPYTDRSGIVHTPTLDKASMHDRIAAYCKYLVKTFDLDGINLDFEPIGSGASNEDYRTLIKKVREAIGPTKHLSIVGNLFSENMSDMELSKYGSLLDMVVIMDYDTGNTSGTAPYPVNSYTNNTSSYIQAVQENIVRISKALPAGCELIPLGPGIYRHTPYHPSYENAFNHSMAVNQAILEGARVAGSGVWWFAQAMYDDSETQNFIDYWIEGNQDLLNID